MSDPKGPDSHGIVTPEQLAALEKAAAEKQPLVPPASPRTGRLSDDLDNLPDLPEVLSDSIYVQLEKVLEIFFRIGLMKKFRDLNCKTRNNADLLKLSDARPFEPQVLRELLRRARKGVISIEEIRFRYIDETKNKRALVDYVSTQIDAGTIEIIELKNKLESPVLSELLTLLIYYGIISANEIYDFNLNQDLSRFMREQGLVNLNGPQSQEIVDLPMVKPASKSPAPVPVPPPTVGRVPTSIFPPAPPTVPAVPGKMSASFVPPAPASVPPGFKVPSPKGYKPQISSKNPTLVTGVFNPSSDSAPGAPTSTTQKAGVSGPVIHLPPPVPASVEDRNTLPLGVHQPESKSATPPPPPHSQPLTGKYTRTRKPTLMGMSGPPGPMSVAPASLPAVTVREGAGKDNGPRAMDPTIMSDADPATGTASAAPKSLDVPWETGLVSEGQPSALSMPPRSVGAPKSAPPSLPFSVPRPKSSATPPPFPQQANAPQLREAAEAPVVLLHGVTIMGTANHPFETQTVPLLMESGEFTFGTNPQNHIVLTNPAGTDGIADYQGVIKIHDGKIFVKATKAGVNVEPIPGSRRGIVVASYVELTDEDPITLTTNIHGNPNDALAVLKVRLEQGFLEEEVKDHYEKQCKQLLRLSAETAFAAINSKAGKADITSKDTEHARQLRKRARDLFVNLQVRVQSQTKDTDFETWNAVAFQDLKDELHALLVNTIIEYGKKLLETTRTDIINATANGKLLDDLELQNELPKNYQEIFDFAYMFGINLKKGDYTKLISDAEAESRRMLREVQMQQKEAIEAEKRAREMSDEIAQRPQREHEAALMHFRQLYTDIHFLSDGENKEMLTAETKVAHVGPMLIITDTARNLVTAKPLLVGRETIGSHGINTVELPIDYDPKRGTKPFMVGVEFDERSGEYRMTWIDGSVSFTTKEIPLTPVFAMEYGKPINVGKYLIKIEKNHAFTKECITKAHANPHAEELCEIIFDEDITTLEQTKQAYDDLKTLASSGHVNKDGLRSLLEIKIREMWDRIGAWTHELPTEPPHEDFAPISASAMKKTIADAQALGVLHMLLADRGGFIPRIDGITQTTVIEAAKKRFEAYVKLNNKSHEKDLSFSRIRSLFASGRASIQKHNQERVEAKKRSEVGVIEIARFLDMGILTQDVVNSEPEMTDEYNDRVNEIYQIRKIIAEIKNGGNEIDHLEEAMGRCGEKTMGEVFGVDEIAAFNVNIEVNITAKTPVIQYLKKLCVFLGRSHLRLLGNEDNQKSLTTINKLFEAKAITYADLLIPPFFTVADVESQVMQARLMAEVKAEAEKARLKLEAEKIHGLQQHIDHKNKIRGKLIQRFANVVDALSRAVENTRLDILLEVADIIQDPNIDTEMDGDGISMEVIRYAQDLPTEKSRFKDRAHVIVADRHRVGWPTVKADYYHQAHKLAVAAVMKIMDHDKDSAYEFECLKEAIEKRLISEQDLQGFTLENLQKVVKLTTENDKRRPFRKKYQPIFDEHIKRSTDDLGYLETVDLAALKDPIEREVAAELIDSISYMRLSNIIENIKKGKDVAYMKLVAQELIEKGYKAQESFDAQELALLQ